MAHMFVSFWRNGRHQMKHVQNVQEAARFVGREQREETSGAHSVVHADWRGEFVHATVVDEKEIFRAGEAFMGAHNSAHHSKAEKASSMREWQEFCRKFPKVKSE